MAEQIPYYAKNLQDSLNGMYGHNILNGGDTSPEGRLYSSITATNGCTVTYTKYTGIPTNGDAVVVSLALNARQRIITGAVEDITVVGIGAAIVAQILEL